MEQAAMVFCTLFDSNYLDKGLVLYGSMEKNIKNFKLYIFAFDDRCFEVLSNMNLKNVIVLSVEDIMTPALQQIKKERSRAEFCWTCTPLVIEHVLIKYDEKICTYIDADIYFFSSPLEAIQQFIASGCSVGLVEHRFERNSEYGSHVFSVGKYCIQFNTFFNNREGIQVLTDWKNSCLEWCYCRYEDGKYGDQKYPDKWRQKYSCIYEYPHWGLGVAPWNLHLYKYIGLIDKKICLKYRDRKFELVFYHFEGMKYLSDGKVYLNLWKPSAQGERCKTKILYGEYFERIESVREFLLKKYNITFEHMFINKDSFFGKNYSLRQFCKEDGVIDGIQRWVGHWMNNLYTSRGYRERGQG